MVSERAAVLLIAVIALAACASVSPPREQPGASKPRVSTVTLVISGMT